MGSSLIDRKLIRDHYFVIPYSTYGRRYTVEDVIKNSDGITFQHIAITAAARTYGSQCIPALKAEIAYHGRQLAVI
jgi:hypothetical protein